jgi:hypothetical protein
LPEETRDALWKKHKRQLAFPAGLEPFPDDGEVRAFWNEFLALFKGGTEVRRDEFSKMVLEKLLAMTDEDLVALIRKHCAPSELGLAPISPRIEKAPPPSECSDEIPF